MKRWPGWRRPIRTFGLRLVRSTMTSVAASLGRTLAWVRSRGARVSRSARSSLIAAPKPVQLASAILWFKGGWGIRVRPAEPMHAMGPLQRYDGALQRLDERE